MNQLGAAKYKTHNLYNILLSIIAPRCGRRYNKWKRDPQSQTKTHRHEALLHEGCEDVWPDGDHDVPEVQGRDGAAVVLVPLDESLPRMFQLHLLRKGVWRRVEGS